MCLHATSLRERGCGRLAPWPRLRPYGAGVYANFISDEGAAGVAYAYGEHLARLRALKAVHDPDNFFRLNNNITPPG